MRAQHDRDDRDAVVTDVILVRTTNDDWLLELGPGRLRAQDEVLPVVVEPLAGELVEIVAIALDNDDQSSIGGW